MLDSVTLDDSIDAGASQATPAISARCVAELSAVEGVWDRLTASGVESPGQLPGFIRLWAATQGISRQVFVVGEVEGVPVALLPLRRERRAGITILTFMPGSHVGCNGPVVDAARLMALGPAGRQALWRAMLQAISGDLVYLAYVPDEPHFAELGAAIGADTLYRAQFASWEEANTTQRNKSRRKHDRQQGEKLEALGSVTFGEIANGDDTGAVLDIMFRQRAARFVEMGVSDPFADQTVRDFYYKAAQAGSGVEVRLHVLRLDGEIVAVRYNIVAGSRMFCLISSMSTEQRLQPGSPGKQCLLRVMQTVFDGGYTTFDMGSGYTDEKRHWCNVQIPVRHHYLPLTPAGAMAATVHRSLKTMRRQIKENPRLLAFAKRIRGAVVRQVGPAQAAKSED